MKNLIKRFLVKILKKQNVFDVPTCIHCDVHFHLHCKKLYKLQNHRLRHIREQFHRKSLKNESSILQHNKNKSRDVIQLIYQRCDAVLLTHARRVRVRERSNELNDRQQVRRMSRHIKRK
jgi:hypothetical protein